MDRTDLKDFYLICDLDGTLLKNDFFIELFVKSVVKRPFGTVGRLLKGLLPLKHFLLDDHNPDIVNVVNEHVIALLEREKASFKKLILLSASTDSFVKKVGRQLMIFDECHGSIDINLKGQKKLEYIKQQGWEPFVYIGDAKADNAIFAAAEYYYIIKNNTPILIK